MKKTLLIVDDASAIQLVLKHYFEPEFEVVTKPNGLAALQWLQEGNAADAVVADYDMPVMNGLDLIQQLRSSAFHRHLPIIILSGKEETSHKIKCLRLGADDYMVKPFNPEELELRLKNALRKQTVQ